ncbi:hypothetical protein B0A50_02057 [Salinomyces thailandicus]|uniref:Imidazoleglycerol-phosphate dehydratase n=1 Tax=Salinomyces thailandicus TaxID=706561 RepID=A0A4V5N5F9_9PEZI|nr:hypothetical protein B0A50_02057 [Salinomyces thailandica]
MVRTHGSLMHDEELNSAAWVAARGAAVGAAKWGLFSAVAAGVGLLYSPMYRGLTIQFKVFLQMSGMTLGSMIEADHRLRAHELIIRNHKKLARDLEVWKRYEAEIERSAEEAASTKTRDAEK